MTSDGIRTRSALATIVFVACTASAHAADPATSDLAALIGQWQTQWTYSPGTRDERIVNGTLSCEYALNDQHIFCRYFFARKELPDIIEHVYFNYNTIYDRYEAIWVSGTWPIKVLMAGQASTADGLALDMAADFPLQNGVREQVRSEMSIDSAGQLSRQTFIRTSEDAEGQWTHHMNETAVRVD